MEIKVCRSTEISEQEWHTYACGFNEVFHRGFPVNYFQNKYLETYKGYSCHSILLSDDGEAVGGITIIPCYYYRDKERFTNGLAVDVFIRKTYRVDPLMLRRMYKKLCPLLEEEGVVAVIAVPNATAYPYWKNVVKWLDVGRINYWMLPVRVGNILGKKGLLCRILNIISLMYCGLVYCCSALILLWKFEDKRYKYRICQDDVYYNKKFSSESYVKEKDYIYKIENEEGVRTGYVLKVERNGIRNSRLLFECISKILENHVDIVLYVGKLGFFQSLMIKLPKKLEPKLLPMTCDFISKGEKYKDMLDIDNWDFGLQNYDVR